MEMFTPRHGFSDSGIAMLFRKTLTCCCFLIVAAATLCADDCVDQNLHFTVREFRGKVEFSGKEEVHGKVIDITGKPAAHVEGELFRFHKVKDTNGTNFEPGQSVTAHFVTDEQGHFQLRNLHHGMYLVLLHAPYPYDIPRLVIKVDKRGSSSHLVGVLGLSPTCQGTWRLASEEK